MREQFIPVESSGVMGLRDRIHRLHSGTGMHCDRVAFMAQEIACLSGLGEESMDKVFNAGLIHDLGKVDPTFYYIHFKGRDLTPVDWLAIKRHPENGAYEARKEGLDDLAPIIRQHHERVDGNGYYGMKEISPEASVLIYADVFDALTSNGRSYREPVSWEAARDIILDDVGTHFNPDFKDAFTQFVEGGL